MSSLSANLCLFSAALCNIAVLDQNLFDVQNSQQQQYGALYNQASNIFGTFGLGGFSGGNPQGQGQKRQRTPHQSPCGRKFQYVSNGREWKGIIKIKNVNLNDDTLIQADFVLPQGLQKRNYNGKIDLVNQGDSINDDLLNGLPLLFEAQFASQNPVPRLVAIYKNKREICSGPLESTNGLTTFRLKYELKALSGISEDRINPDEQIPSDPQISAQPQITVSQPNQFQSDSSICGIPVAGFTQSLVIGGQPTGHGEWPWLVAFYRSSKGNLEFICGASLISSSHTITAAHCIIDKGRTEPMQTKNALLFIGKHNLIEWNEEGYEKKGAKAFKIHPEWKPAETRYDADIALIELDSAVTYSKFIRPICLWTESTDINNVVGQTGIIAGWGKNENGELNTDFPKKVNAPIVSEGSCLRTHEAFVHITSDRTFCAGGKMGEGPCQGDSGGGLMLRGNGKKWFLRGIVSASLRDGNTCDVNNFAVFTDVAKFIPWIKSLM